MLDIYINFSLTFVWGKLHFTAKMTMVPSRDPSYGIIKSPFTLVPENPEPNHNPTASP